MSFEKDFIKAMQENSGIINSICRSYFPVQDDFKDARQDVILQLWRSFPTFRNESKISTWIYKVALNTILTKRKKAQNQRLNEPISQVHIDQIPSHDDVTKDHIQEFTWLISKLDDCDKAIVILLVEGYNNKEIALMLHLTATNISTRLNRLKNKLKHRINEH
jgi:RNA polymerase sigma factor (sigma-70 family)